MNLHTTKAGRKRQRGLALVEFALVMPLLAFLMFSTAELGRAIYQYNTLTKAVRDGARYLADRGMGSSGLLILSPADITLAQNLVVYGNPAGSGTPLLDGFTAGDVNVAVQANRFVRVTATYRFNPVLAPLPTFGLGDGDGINIGPFTTTAVMRGLQ